MCAIIAQFIRDLLDFAGLSSNLVYITSVFIGYIGTDLDERFNKTLRCRCRRIFAEINNQRKAFSICWRRRELITDAENPKSWLWRRHCRRRAIYWLLRSSSNLVTLNSKLKSTGAGYQLLSVGGMPTASSLAWKTSLRKSVTPWHCSRLRSVALYPWLIVYIRQAPTCCSNIWASLPSAGVMSSVIAIDSLIAKFKEVGGTVREIDVWAESSHYLCSGYLHHRLPVMGC